MSRDYDQQRFNSAERGYNARWRRYRRGYLKEHPLCVKCQALGLVVPATVVDHIIPHKGDYDLFWDPENHQALCKPCHDAKTLEEMGKPTHKLKGCTVGGLPTDPRHPWSK